MTRSLRSPIKRFLNSQERLLILPFDGLREDVCNHWHRFLASNSKSRIRKSVVLALTRNMPSCRLKRCLLRGIGVRIGTNVFIAATVRLDPHFPELIEIGDNAIIGMYAHVFTHEVTHSHIRLGRVRIGKNALVGALSTVRSGTSIADNAAVGMVSFANEDVPENTLLVGEPLQRRTRLHSIL